MGGLFGAYLARAGENVVLIDVSKSAVDEINKNGLTIEEKDGSTSTTKVIASLDPETCGSGRPHHQFCEVLPHRRRHSGGDAYGNATDLLPVSTERLGQCRPYRGDRRRRRE